MSLCMFSAHWPVHWKSSLLWWCCLLTGEAILQCGCEQGSTECQRKGCVEGDSRWTKGKGKETLSVWSLQLQCSQQFWCLISSVCQPSCWDLSSLPAQTGQISEWVLVFLPFTFPPAVPYSCLAAPGRLAQLLCSAGVSSKGNGNLAAAFSQTRRKPSWWQILAKILGLGVISLQIDLYWKCLGLVSWVLESSWNQYIWLLLVLMGVLLACFYSRDVVQVLKGHTEYWRRPSATPPALLKLMVLGKKKGVEDAAAFLW